MSLKSDISFEAFIYTNIPLKCQYNLQYKMEYGRNELKWEELVSKPLYKSRSSIFEYSFGLQKQEVTLLSLFFRLLLKLTLFL